MRLYLVRHAAVVVQADRPSSQWYLSLEGRAAAGALAEEPYWSDIAIISSSPEPKAVATAQRIAARHGLAIRTEPDLREVERPWAEDGYRELAQRYLAGEDIDGWEPLSGARGRALRCIGRVIEVADGQDAAVVSHGLLLTLYLSDLLQLDAAGARALWSGIGFPDVAAVEPSTRSLIRPFGKR